LASSSAITAQQGALPGVGRRCQIDQFAYAFPTTYAELVRVSGGEPADAARSACGPGQGRQSDMNAAVEPTAFT
jgi:hypothetical protein